jgi:hypothetical protein
LKGERLNFGLFAITQDETVFLNFTVSLCIVIPPFLNDMTSEMSWPRGGAGLSTSGSGPQMSQL